MHTIQTRSFRPPLPSRATRIPSPRSKASSRGHVVCRTQHDSRPRLRYFESKPEQEVLYLLLANPNVVDIWEQPPGITYRDTHGKPHTHTFDFLATMADGRRLALVVKPISKSLDPSFSQTLKLIKAATPLSFANDVVLITRRNFRPSAARNAEKLHDFRRTPDPEADAAISRLITTMTGPMTMGELAEQSGFAGRGFRAAFRAIYAGALQVLDKGDILPTTRVTAAVVS